MHADTISQLYREHAPALTAHCIGLLGDPAQARDAVHEAFERVMRVDNQDLDGGKRTVRYLYRTSTNVCIDHLRQRGVWRRVQPEVTHRAEQREKQEPRHAERDYARQLLRRCDRKTAQVGVMRFVQEMNQQEIAEQLGMSRRSVFNRLRKLAERAAELHGEEQLLTS